MTRFTIYFLALSALRFLLGEANRLVLPLRQKNRTLVELASHTQKAAARTASAVVKKQKTRKDDKDDKDDDDDDDDAASANHRAMGVPSQNLLANVNAGGAAHDPTDMRPHAGGGAEVVNFGIYTKAVYSIDVKAGTWTADVILTLQWKDERAASVVPEGLDSLSLSQASAAKKMWIPDIMISNRAIKGVDVLSTTFTVSKMGDVQKVERALVVLQNVYFVHAFPFDKQVLKVRIASATLMAEELMLSPIRGDGISGIDMQTLDSKDFYIIGFTTGTVMEEDSSMKKNRGELSISVGRQYWPYVLSMLMPEVLLLGISYSAFWFPQVAVFAMPRTATAIISFLSMLTLSIKHNSMLPVRGGLAWIDLFESSCQGIMFLTVCFNIFVLVTFHKFKKETLAMEMDFELKIIFPAMLACMFVVLIYKTDGTELSGMSTLLNLILAIGAFGFTFSVGHRLRQEWRQDALDAK